MNPLTPPHTTSPSTSSSNETAYFHPRSNSKHRSSSHFSSSHSSSSSSSSSSPEAKRPRASTLTKPSTHFPTPALTPEHLPPPTSASTTDSHFPPTSADSIEGPKGFVQRDDLTRKAVAATHAQSHEAVQQMEKDRFVNGLVGASVLAIESIWGPSTPVGTTQFSTPSSVLPLHYFVREVLRRSRTSCSTLQLCLYYLHKSRKPIRDAVALAQASREEIQKLALKTEEEKEKEVESFVNSDYYSKEEEDVDPASSYPSPPESPDTPHLSTTPSSDSPSEESLSSLITRLLHAQKSPLLCGRRMFLASLISASKYLQDRNYSNKAWSRISGLNVQEINENERAFLELVGWELHLSAGDFGRWVERLNTLTASSSSSSGVSGKRNGLERSSSEYVSAPNSSQTSASVALSTQQQPQQQQRPTSSNLLRSKLALTRGNSAPQLEPSHSHSHSKEFPIAQPPTRRLPITLPTSTTSTKEEEVELESTEEEDNGIVEKSVKVERKVRGLPIRRHKLGSNGIPSNWSVGAGVGFVGIERSSGELIRVH
ncbi:hypothetical protein JCM5353_006588 [Sporobolomyces roseus]